MQTTGVLPWLRNRRVVALLVALALTISLAIGLGTSGPQAAADGHEPAAVELVADDELVIAGPSWTWLLTPPSGSVPPSRSLGPSWG